MADTPLSKKLGIKPGYKALVLNPPEGYAQLLGGLPEDAQLSSSVGDGPYDVVHAFARNSDDLRRLAPEAMAALKPGGALWLSYPKKSSKVATDLERDGSWDPLTAAGLRIVSSISVDDVWSGLRFRPISDVKTTKG